MLCGIIEDRHLLRTHHDKPLLLDGMQPADEHVGLDPTREVEVAQGDVKDVAIQIGSALARDTNRHLVEQRQHHRDVVRGKAPENVLLGANLADVQTVGVEVVDLSEGAVANQLLQLQDRGVISENVSDHEDSALRRREPHQLLAVLHVHGQGLLDEHVLARFQSRSGHFVEGHGGGGQRDGGNRRIGEDRAEFSVESDALVFAPAPLFDRPFGITECGQGAKFVEVPNEVLPPIANSDDGDARLRPTDSAALHGHLTYPRNSTHLAAARPSP